MASRFQNARLGLKYTGLAAAGFGIGAVFQPIGVILWWPAATLLHVACGYFGYGGAVFHKRGGTHPLWAQIWFFPIFLGHECSRRYYARECKSWDCLLPGLLIGRQLTPQEANDLEEDGLTAVLDLTSEFSEPKSLRKLDYRNLPLLDLTAPTSYQITEAIAFISEARSKGKVLVHCKAGYSRTAAIAGSYLVATGHVRTADEAMEQLRKVRPTLVIRPEAEQAIRAYSNLNSPWLPS